MASAKYHLVAFGVCLAGLWLFCTGFMVLRMRVTEKSTKENPPVSTLFDWSHLTEDDGWLPVPKRLRLCLLVIDALRYDFARKIHSKGNDSNRIEAFQPYHNQLKALSEWSEQGKGRLFQFVADAPTATAQRLKALTCGTLPSFIEAGSVFAEGHQLQDSLIRQLLCKSNNDNPRIVSPRVHFVGDDTWLHMFSELEGQLKAHQKNKAKELFVKGFWSFGLFDLTTVDDAIKAEFARKGFPWQCPGQGPKEHIIAHFLGLDHCGHKHGPQHANCAAKLSEMDSVLRDVSYKLSGAGDIYKGQSSNDMGTFLVVLGDHGMTEGGDHGGDSPQELTATLYIASTNDNDGIAVDSKVVELFERARDLRKRHLADFLGKTAGLFAEDNAVAQIDLVPTVALALGLPIPFASLGNLIPEALPLPSQDQAAYLLDAVRLVTHQLFSFLRHYGQIDSGTGGFGMEDPVVALLEARLATMEHYLAGKSNATGKTKPDDLMDEIELHEAFLSYYALNQELVLYCRERWSPSSPARMFSGIVLMLGALLIMLLSDSISSLIPALVYPVIHGLCLMSTSFVVFEEWLVRFGASLLLLPLNPGQFLFAGKGFILAYGKALSGLSFFVLSRMLGVCREEQHPFCTSISHRDIPIGLNLYTGLSLICALVCSFIYLSKVGRRHRWLLFWFVACCLSWAVRWAQDVNAELFEKGSVWDVIMQIWLPRVVYATTAWSIVTAPGHSTHPILVLVSFVQRPLGGFVMLTLGTHIAELIDSDDPRCAPFYFLLASAFSFSTGHQMTLTHVHWEAAFLGFPEEAPHAIYAILVGLNTVGPFLWLSTLLCNRKNTQAQAQFMFYHAVLLTCCAAACFILFRHLMIWKIFAPRLLLQALMASTSYGVFLLHHIIESVGENGKWMKQKYIHNNQTDQRIKKDKN